MARFSAIFCDICQQVIEEGTYSIRVESRKKHRALLSREYAEVCADCGAVLVNRLQRLLEQTISERRALKPSQPPET